MWFSNYSKKGAIFIFIFFISISLFAQSKEDVQTGELNVSVGDTLVLGKPKSAEVFAYIDIFKKTRWDPRPLPDDEFTRKFKTYDSSTGNGFYRWFFRGDFDAAELPAKYQGRKFPILGLEVLSREKSGEPYHVVYLKTDKDEVVIMVDIDQAAQFDEIAGVIFALKP